MSGATIETLEDELFLITLSTPCISFTTDPVTGESPEQDYHRRASTEFRELLARVRGPVAEGLAAVFARLGERADLIPFDRGLVEVREWNREELRARGNGCCRLSLIAAAAGPCELEICLARLPDDDTLEELTAALKRMMGEAFASG